MKKNNILIIILFVLYGLLPVFDGLAHLFGCEITLISYDHVALVLAAVSVVITALLVMSKENKAGKCCKVLAAVLPIVHMLNWLAYAYHGRTAVVMIAMAACFVCSVGVCAVYCNKTVLKTATLVLALIMLIPVFVIEPVSAVEEGVLLESAYAPGGRYYTQVYMYGDLNENGKTVVKLYDQKVDADLWLFSIKSSTKVIYEGSFDECMDIEVRWDNLGTLTIDGKEYKLN